jgi:hypothetical protein
MKITQYPKEVQAKMKNGDLVRYDRIEDHDGKKLFFRGSLGLVYATYQDNVESYEVKE